MMSLLFSLLLVLLSTIGLFWILQYLLRSHYWKQIELLRKQSFSPDNEPDGPQ